MKLPARTVVLVLLIVVTGAAVVVLASGRAEPAAEVTLPAYQGPTPEPFDAVKGRAVGQSGCLAAACHGAPAEKLLEGQRDENCWQASGSAWAAADPHRNAYSALTDPKRRVTAKSIMEKLHSPIPATEDSRCLACHTNPSLAEPGATADPHVLGLRREGVSCEACHGNAGGWIRSHTARTGDPGPVYDKTGMTKLYDIGERAMNCVGCHVGAPADPQRGYAVRDMNHDMIAAGHPRLNFDFGEYLRRLPAHWEEKDRTANGNNPRVLNPVTAWYVGRVAHAEAACFLLADRADRALKNDERTPWPEFAEFNCAACHHNLRVPNEGEKYADWRKSAEYLGDRPLGSTPWQTIWPVGHAPGIPKPSRGESWLKDVVVTMETVRSPKPETAKKAAGSAAWKFRQERVSFVAKPDAQVERHAAKFFPNGAPRVPEWDSAEQLFLGFAALERARAKPDPARLENFRRGVAAFRARDWPCVEQAFEAIRKK